jgi:hypothetical protein
MGLPALLEAMADAMSVERATRGVVLFLACVLQHNTRKRQLYFWHDLQTFRSGPLDRDPQKCPPAA